MLLEPIRTLRVVSLLLLLVNASLAKQSTWQSLKDHVTIFRDQYGVPHIVGDSEPATFFGYGYAQAQDHLEQMMLLYRDAQGRRSEVLGGEALNANPLQFIQNDYRWGGDYLQRLFRTWRGVAEHKDEIDPAVYQLLDAFARGVNQFIDEHRAQIPAWIERVSAVDIEALERCNYMRFYSVGDALSKMTGGPQSYPRLGSNQWAIGPRKSADGRIIHVESLHMPWSNQLQLYEAHLITPGKLDVAGISWFGSPFFLCGFNEKITWSVTWNQPNIADVYEERISPNGKQYLYAGNWRNIHTDPAAFKVRSSKGVLETRILPLYYTHHGPIVRFEKERHRAFSVKPPNFTGVNYSTGWYRLMKADSIDNFKVALSQQLIVRWNFLCTDAKNMYWVHNGVVASRNPNFDWSKPVPGWLKETEWRGYLPFSANPQLSNPASGFLQNCNNPPWLATRNSGLDPLEPAPYYLQHARSPAFGSFVESLLRPYFKQKREEALNARGERVFSILAQQDKKFTSEQMVNMAFDTYVLAADVVVPLLEQAATRMQPVRDSRLNRAVDELKAWDRRASADSYAYTYLFYWAKAYERRRSTAEFARFNAPSRQSIQIHSWREQTEAWYALEEAVNRIQARFGKARVRWGEINRVVRGGDFAVDGTGTFDVLHPDSGPEQLNGRILCDGDWGHLMIVMEGEPKQVWSLLPYGQSEHHESRHYNDQAILHSQKRVKPFWFTYADVLKNTESTWGDPGRLQRLLRASNEGRPVSEPHTGSVRPRHTRTEEKRGPTVSAG